MLSDASGLHPIAPNPIALVTDRPDPTVVHNLLHPTGPSQLPASWESLSEPLPPLDRVDVWDVPFDRVTLDQSIDRIEQLMFRRIPSYVITANLNYCMLHHREAELQQITRDADLILADGQPIVNRSRLGNSPLPERVAGSEMIYRLAERCRDRGQGIYFLGGEPGVGQRCADTLAELYPGLRIAGVESPPFRQLNEVEQLQQDARIQSSDAGLLLVAFGQPKGEKWIHANYQRLGVPVSIQVGASFEFVAGTSKRAPESWQRLGMEWAHRMFSDPKRLVPRYASNAAFLAGRCIEDWKRLVTSWGMGEWSDRR
ncbi:WecB/TagA/CpsF family glycosyltransferase [Novipirellula artificiosorum]|uniref:Putative N-acetylmannosaminyltransferase n=1 Tax=Novipirellula artificiosorum TaxID=2528016 RepID=A0A5C6DPF7_9BACT|nr:WecB/TagA/CpsF family glycosyltransferase [Novipirellula artificiosorum]TWU38492.1 putative N-acetylmannosaminyltransferase [Novipirellula artificiosorum]